LIVSTIASMIKVKRDPSAQAHAGRISTAKPDRKRSNEEK